MESNENSEDKSVETTNEIEVEQPVVEDKIQKESDGTNVKKVVAEEDRTGESEDSTSVKPNETESKTTSESERIDDKKINTLPNEPSVVEEERKDDEPTPDIPENPKDTVNTQEDTPTPAVTPAAPKESRRKRKSTNQLPEISATALATEPVIAAEVEEQNGSSSRKRKKLDEKCDKYCWRCHKESVETQCSACPRSWHRRCMGGAPPLSVSNWICGECVSILEAENVESRSPVMADITVDQLCMMLRHVIDRMRDQHGSEPFWRAVDLDEVPSYLDYVVKPMDLSLLESNVRAKSYGSTDAFMADAKWIQHNCIVFNTYTSKLTNTAKQMLKVARQEVSEIETCPDCFARGRNLPRALPSWFIEPCRRPHPIVWAKLKGFPFWPAKAMSRINAQGLVDVRFFGEHDRAWVSPKDIYLYSQEPPAMLPKKKKLEMEQCVIEVKEHIGKLEKVIGEFRYASPKVPYDPHDPMQIKVLLPDYDPSRNIKNDAPKTDANKKQQTPVQTPVNNKATALKVEKKHQNLKNAVVAITNGIVETSIIEKRKLDRKRKVVEPAKEVVNEVIPETPEVIINHKSKSKSKSPPVTAVVMNNSTNDDPHTSMCNSEATKNNKTPEVRVIEVTNDSTPKKIITAVKQLKNDTPKKIKLSKNYDSEEVIKTIRIPNRTNGKQPSLLKVYRPVNNLQNSSDAANDVTPNKKTKTIYIQSKKRMAGSSAKVLAKNSSPEQRLANIASNRTPKIVVNNIQKNIKDGTANHKPMTAIPLPTRNDQVKPIFLPLNSSASESAKNLSENMTIPIIKQEPKDDIPQPKLTIVRKPGKARKSLPNRPPAFSHAVKSATSRPIAKISSNTTDTLANIPFTNTGARTSTFAFPPPEAGPETAKIHQSSKELVNRMAQLIVETIQSTAENSNLSLGNTISNQEATIQTLKLSIERLKWEHQQRIAEMRHNHDLVLREMKAGMDVERLRALQEAKSEAELEKQRCIEETKRRQWCVVCGREALFYCCWNTAYCDYPCQQKHWTSHIATCAQKSLKSNNSSSEQQPQQSKPVSESTTNGQQNGNISDEVQTVSTGSM